MEIGPLSIVCEEGKNHTIDWVVWNKVITIVSKHIMLKYEWKICHLTLIYSGDFFFVVAVFILNEVLALHKLRHPTL